MAKPLRILMASSEYAPYAKAGGLGDAVAGLAGALIRRGHDVRVALPRYAPLSTWQTETESVLDSMGVSMGMGEEWCAVDRILAPHAVPVYLIRHDNFFNRDGLYHDGYMNDYLDNPRRFGFFCRAALQLCMDTGFSPDIVHCNDWQTALIPAYLKVWFWDQLHLGQAASVLTIHNVAHQGVYPRAHYGYLGLGHGNFTEDKFESWGQVNFLKGGVHFADAVNTVSPGHAREITDAFGGFGLAPYLSRKGDTFSGILNGVDYAIWSPESDQLLPVNYSVDDLGGKAECKRHLQNAFGLNQDPKACIIGTVGRFVDQKGFHLLRDAIERVLNDMAVQFVILGSGDWGLQEYFGNLPARYPGRAGSWIGFNNEYAHLIEAGADFYIMPSLFEPCGLNQLYSLRYGTLPIVRATGGLEDTVEQYDEARGTGTGFKFHEPSSHALYYTIGWAVSTYYDRPRHMKSLIHRAMKKDFSWDRSARQYESVYRRSIAARRGGKRG